MKMPIKGRKLDSILKVVRSLWLSEGGKDTVELVSIVAHVLE